MDIGLLLHAHFLDDWSQKESVPNAVVRSEQRPSYPTSTILHSYYGNLLSHLTTQSLET